MIAIDFSSFQECPEHAPWFPLKWNEEVLGKRDIYESPRDLMCVWQTLNDYQSGDLGFSTHRGISRAFPFQLKYPFARNDVIMPRDSSHNLFTVRLKQSIGPAPQLWLDIRRIHGSVVYFVLVRFQFWSPFFTRFFSLGIFGGKGRNRVRKIIFFSRFFQSLALLLILSTVLN